MHAARRAPASVCCHPSTARGRRPKRGVWLAQMLAPVQPLDVSLSLSQHELEKLQKGALQRRKPPPLTPTADDAAPPPAAGTSAGTPDLHARNTQSLDSLAIPHWILAAGREVLRGVCRAACTSLCITQEPHLS